MSAKYGTQVILKHPQIDLLKRILAGERITDSTGKYQYRAADGTKVQRDLVVFLHSNRLVNQILDDDECVLKITEAGKTALQMAELRARAGAK